MAFSFGKSGQTQHGRVANSPSRPKCCPTYRSSRAKGNENQRPEPQNFGDTPSAAVEDTVTDTFAPMAPAAHALLSFDSAIVHGLHTRIDRIPQKNFPLPGILLSLISLTDGSLQ